MRYFRFSSLSDVNFVELLRASSWVFVARLVSTALGLFTWILIARWFGKEATGYLALINSVGAVFAVVSVFGLGMSVMREFASSDLEHQTARKRKLYLRALTVVLAIFILLLGPALFILLPGFSDKKSGLLMAWLAVATLTLFGRTLVTLNVNISRSIVTARIYGLFLLAPTLLTFIIVIVLGVSGLTKTILPSVAFMIGSLATGVAALVIILARIRHAREESSATSGEVPSHIGLIRQGFPFAVSASFGMLVSEGNIVVASFFLPIDEIGVYSIAHKLALLVTFVLSTFTLVAAPRFSRLSAEGDLEQLKAYGRKISTLIFWGSLPILVILLVSRHYLIETAFGPDFLPATQVLAVLLVGQFANVLTGVTNPYLNMTGGQVLLSRIAVAAAVINIGLSIFLVPRMGVIGAAIAMSASLTFWNSAALVAIRMRDGFWMCYVPRFRPTKQALRR